MNPKRPKEAPSSEAPDVVRRHLLAGWVGLFVFVVLGVVLEGLHAFKAPLYLDVENETRRFFFRLAHAHGTLLSILQFGLAGTLSWLEAKRAPTRVGFVSTCFITALVLLPAGFFFAGVGATAGDPGWGIVLVPGGALFLLAGVGSLCRAVWRAE